MKPLSIKIKIRKQSKVIRAKLEKANGLIRK
jgi:hypothetical protein